MAQGNFAACEPVTLAFEGGKVDNPADPGGRTNEGVTQRSYDAYRRRKGLALRDVYLMTPAERDEIYLADYWTPAGCEDLAPGEDLVHFDGTVNSGLGNSRKWLAAARRVSDTAASIHAYSAARLMSLHSFRAWATFRKGWVSRVAGVEAKAITMATSPEFAKATIAKASNAAATIANAASVTAHAAAVTAGASAAVAPSHLAIGIVGLLVSIGTAIWSAFRASTAGARAAVLAHAATAP